MIAVIPARGGSVRLPRKNLKPICGHPLVAWTIMQCLCSHGIDDVYVTTDDDEIESVSRRYGAKVIRRPEWQDANLAAAGRPFIHAFRWLMERGVITESSLVFSTLCTTPMRYPWDIDRMIDEQKRYPDSKAAIGTKARMRELFAYRVTGPSEVIPVICGKDYKFAMDGWSGNVHSVDMYLKSELPYGEDHDAVINAKMEIPKDPLPTPAMWVEWWQGLEVDTEEEFQLAELLFDFYILRGRGMRIYHSYKESQV